MKGNLNNLAKAELPIMVTEMDVLPGIYLLSLREGNRMYHRKVVVK